VRKALYLILIAGAAFGQTPQPTDTVLAWKPQTPYMHGASGWPSMPHNLWTNSVLWLTAESPVLNLGATNAQWICYAKTCAGNATQVDVNRQPLRVLTNDFWRLRFDGTDDFISVANVSGVRFTNAFHVSAWVNTKTNVNQRIVSKDEIAGSKRSYILFLSDGRPRFITFKSGAVQSAHGSTTLLTNVWHHIVGVNDGSDLRLYLNGQLNAVAIGGGGAVDDKSAPVMIGRFEGTLEYFLGDLGSVAMGAGPISANDVLMLYNSEKSRYGL